MSDAEFLLSLPAFPTFMAIFTYTIFRLIASGPVKLNPYIRKLLLPFSRKNTTSIMFIVIASACYIIILIDLWANFSGFKMAVGSFSFNMFCFSAFSATIAMALAILLITNLHGSSIFDKIGYIFFAGVGIYYSFNAIRAMFNLVLSWL